MTEEPEHERVPARAPAAAGEDGAEPGDGALVRAARAGSLEAFDRLVERWHAPLFRFLVLRLGRRADAEELTQEAFVRAWRKLARYDVRWRFSTWLFTLAKRLAASHERARLLRLRRLAPIEDPHELAGPTPEPWSEAARREEGARLWSVAAAALTCEQCSALWLRYAEGLEVEEIALVLAKRRGTVRGLLFRARAALARRIEAEERAAARERALERRPGRATRAAEATGGTR